MNVTIENGGTGNFYDIHDNDIVYVDKLVGQPTPGMDADTHSDPKKENQVIEAAKQAAARAKGLTQTPDTKGKKSDVPFKPTDATYTYVYQKDCPKAIATLYSALMSKKWLEEHTKLEDFEKLFSGRPSAFTIRWNRETTQLLWYLFKLLKEHNYITRPEGISKWQIEKSHILSKQGRLIDDWHSQHEPTDKTEVEALANLLDPLEAIMNQYDRKEQRLDRDIVKRLYNERMSQNRHHDDDDY